MPNTVIFLFCLVAVVNTPVAMKTFLVKERAVYLGFISNRHTSSVSFYKVFFSLHLVQKKTSLPVSASF